MDGIDHIARERREQKEKHNYSTIRDAEIYKHDELITMVKYFLTDHDDAEYENYEQYLFDDLDGPRLNNNLRIAYRNKSKVNRLKIAGAFIAAQLDLMYYNLMQGPDENLSK